MTFTVWMNINRHKIQIFEWWALKVWDACLWMLITARLSGRNDLNNRGNHTLFNEESTTKTGALRKQKTQSLNKTFFEWSIRTYIALHLTVCSQSTIDEVFVTTPEVFFTPKRSPQITYAPFQPCPNTSLEQNRTVSHGVCQGHWPIL